MFHIACTRFNNDTLAQNLEYRETHGISGVIYGTPIKIRQQYSVMVPIFVAEMNNELNKIEGIGLIKNRLHLDKKYKIYHETEYNRYIYRGNYWISRAEIDPELMTMLENMVFKGRSHLKRQSGISVITPKLFNRWKYDEQYIKTTIKDMFSRKFACDVLE
jgi:hypothetical protein